MAFRSLITSTVLFDRVNLKKEEIKPTKPAQFCQFRIWDKEKFPEMNAVASVLDRFVVFVYCEPICFSAYSPVNN